MTPAGYVRAPARADAVAWCGAVRTIAVTSPSYLSNHRRPKTFDDLKRHECIRFRLTGKMFRWEFAKRGQEITVDVPGALTLDHVELMAEAAARGLGIVYVSEHSSRPWLKRGDLEALLGDWCPSIAGLFLYYPGHRHIPPGLGAFIELLKELG